MSAMWGKRNKFIIFPLLLIILVAATDLLSQVDPTKVPEYSGVALVIPNAESYVEFYWGLSAKHRARYDSLNQIYLELSKRFKEAVDAFEESKESLPSCLNIKMTEWFLHLKKGYKNLEITYIMGDFLKLYRQNYSGGSSGVAGKIKILHAYKQRFIYTHPKTKEKSKPRTAGTFIHELIHNVKDVYNFDCFINWKKAKHRGGKLAGRSAAWIEEFATDCCERIILYLGETRQPST